MPKTVLFQTIQFSVTTLFSSTSLIDRTLSRATTPGQSGPGSDGSKGVLLIPQSSSITVASPSVCFVSYAGHSLGESYSSAEMQLVYSAALADWAKNSVMVIVEWNGIGDQSSILERDCFAFHLTWKKYESICSPFNYL